MIPIISLAALFTILMTCIIYYIVKEKIRERDLKKQIRDFYPFEEDEIYK